MQVCQVSCLSRSRHVLGGGRRAAGGVPAQLPAGSRALTWRSTAASRSATGRNSAL